MRKTVLIVTERRAEISEQEARETVQKCVTLWLKRALEEPESSPDPDGSPDG